MADVAAARGLEVSRLPDPAQRKIKAMLPFAGTINPLDVTGQTLNQPDLLERALAVAIEEGGYDVLAVYLAGMTHSPKLLDRSEEHTSELQSLMRISYAVFCLKKKTKIPRHKYGRLI